MLCISLKISAQLKKECWKLNFTFNVIEDQIKKLILRKKKFMRLIVRVARLTD